ncbi:MAG TPA: HEAT repeat domain-containing protein [Syntrophorhabdales bacterium]|nr:HEAT repeat domain-containing protein [Syntrophorhabdales bacterium]
MFSSTKETLVALLKSGEPEKLIYCLNSLKKEQVDGDFFEIFEGALSAIPKIKPKDFSTVEPALRASLRDISVTVGPESYLKLVACIPSKPSSFLPTLLSPVEDNLQNINAENLLLIAIWPNLPASVSVFLAQCALASDISYAPALLSPFLSLLSEAVVDKGISPETGSVALAIAQNKPILNKLSELLESHDVTRIRSIAGAVVVIGYTEHPNYVPVLGAFLENAGAWNQFVKLILSKERLQALFAKALEAGLSAALSNAYKESSVSGKDLALVLSEDLEVRKSLARLLSSRGAFLSVLRTLADSHMVGVLKEMVSDPYLPCRRAAATALGHYRTDLTISYLKTGLVDPDKQVRESCASTLKIHLGEEGFQRLIDEMEAETNTLSERLKGLSDWATESLSSLGIFAKGAIGKFRDLIADGAWWISDKARVQKGDKEK